MTLIEIKSTIWHHPRIRQNLVELQVSADKAGVLLPISDIREAEKLLKSLNKKDKKIKPRVSDEVYKRYRDAKYNYECGKFPKWINDGHFIEPERPTDDTNGLQNFIEDYLTWTGHFANRTGNEGRVLKDGTRIKSSSKNGMQDMDCNLKHPKHPFGIPWKIEVKAGKDTHKDHQKEYGQQVSSTGAVYSVVKSCADFLQQMDKLLS